MSSDGELAPASGGTGPGSGGGSGGAHTGGTGPGGGGNGGGTPTHTGGTDRITIIINNKEYRVDKPSMTGADLKRLAKGRRTTWSSGSRTIPTWSQAGTTRPYWTTNPSIL